MPDPVVAPVVTPVVPPVVDKPWYDGKADAETVGYLQNKGWDKDPVTAALEASKAHREAEKLIGAPASQLLRLPVDPLKDEAGMRAVWQRLGAPNEAKEYDFPSLKDKDGKITDAALDSALRDNLFKLNVPKQTAAEIASALTKYNADRESAKAVEVAAALKTEHETLTKNWGANEPANKVIASAAAAALGVTAEEIRALEQVVGYARTMELFRNVGTKIGEDKFIRGGTELNRTGVATREQAVAKKAELMSDKAWRDRYLAGDKAALREMTDITKVIVGDDIEGRF